MSPPMPSLEHLGDVFSLCRSVLKEQVKKDHLISYKCCWGSQCLLLRTEHGLEVSTGWGWGSAQLQDGFNWVEIVPVPLSTVSAGVMPLSPEHRQYLEMLQLQVLSEHEDIVGSHHCKDCELCRVLAAPAWFQLLLVQHMHLSQPALSQLAPLELGCEQTPTHTSTDQMLLVGGWV